MGAEPLGMLLAVEAPRGMELAALHRFYAGVLEASRRFACPIVGGNLREGPALACVSTALGEAEPARLLRRDAARPGEALVVVGDMGLFWAGAAARLGALHAAAEHRDELERNLRRPVPRLREALRIAELGLSRCAIDCSDGPHAAFSELAAAGAAVDVHVDVRGVRAHPAVEAVAREGAIDVPRLLLAWGDWQLVCTCDPARFAELEAAMAALGCPAHRVGWVSTGTGRAWYHADEGTGPLAGLPNERFTRGSYFLSTLDEYLALLRETPLANLQHTGEPR
jgi:thiamine-monophosphate kinase